MGEYLKARIYNVKEADLFISGFFFYDSLDALFCVFYYLFLFSCYSRTFEIIHNAHHGVYIEILNIYTTFYKMYIISGSIVFPISYKGFKER